MIILEHTTSAARSERETYWIAHYRAAGHKLGNLTDGGEGWTGKHSEDTKAKIREKRALQVNTVKGMKHSEEARQKMSKSAKARGSNTTGYKHSEESKRKISESKKGKPIASRLVTEAQRKNMSTARLKYIQDNPEEAFISASRGGKAGADARWGKRGLE